MRTRVLIENVRPQLDGGRYAIKRITGERIDVFADIFGDGHDAVRAALLYREVGKKKWNELFMTPLGNDAWAASFRIEEMGVFEYQIEAWIDHLTNWHQGFQKKYADSQHMGVELQIGAELLRKTAKNYSKAKAKPLLDYAKQLEDEQGYEAAVEAVLSEDFSQMVVDFPMKQFEASLPETLKVRVGSPREMFTTWYELFPRSASRQPGKHGTFKDVEALLPRIVEMGFDVLYLPPIHPIGKINRKGKNNATQAGPNDPGSPWAIGSEEGGHKAIHSELGTLADYQSLIKKAKDHGIDMAMDIAFQCAPDHPYIKEHPEWFIWRPDGTIAYAENPPKKYQDIVPLNFETEDWKNLWEELKSIFLYWIDKGVKIFRVDNPHTKAFPFWEWCIAEVHKKHPDVIFLAEAFTRPKVMAALAKGGYNHGYTYFTWRTTKQEMETYINELTKTEWREFFRPNFWPNTPDILPFELFGASSNAFVKRVALAATLSSNYGLYGPAYEYLDNRGNVNGKDEYLDSEKYEIKHYNWDHRNRLTDIITRLNHIRKQHPALQYTYNTLITSTDNDQLMSYVRYTEDLSDIIWCIVNFDPHSTQAGFVEVPLDLFRLRGRAVNLRVHDLLTNEAYHWFNTWNYVALDPNRFPLHVLHVQLNR